MHSLPWAITHICFLPSVYEREFIKFSGTEPERNKPIVLIQVCDYQHIKALPDKN